MWISLLVAIGLLQQSDRMVQQLVDAAEARTHVAVRYDGAYQAIAYPGGDVPDHVGVCSDLIVRAYRALGVDLQKRVHEDMAANFSIYPSRRIWGLERPDPNIDHRRVPNLERFFARHGVTLPVSRDAADYQPGDLVTWRLPGNLPHIGLVSKRRVADGSPLMIHNIGGGPEIENMLFAYPIHGHFRYFPADGEPWNRGSRR